MAKKRKVTTRKKRVKKPTGKKTRSVKKMKVPKKKLRKVSIPKKTKISQRINRKKGEYKISWKRKDRSETELQNILREINYKDLVKKFPKTKFVNVTLFGKFGKKKVGRTYSAQTDFFTSSAIENFLFSFLEDVYKGKLNYGLRKSVRWRNFIEEITFDKFKTNEPRRNRKKVGTAKRTTRNRKRKT